MVSTTAPAPGSSRNPAAPAAAQLPRKVSPLNPANAVTASRFLTLPPLWWSIAHGHHQYATLLLIICGLFDKLDGLVAKIFDCKSAFGEVFDAIADGICYGTGLVLVALYGWAPMPPVIVVLGLGVFNTALRFVYAGRAGRTINYKSYAMERIVAYTGYLIAFATSGTEVQYFFWLMVPTFAIVVAHDVKRMLIDPVPAKDAA